jgi:ATP-dependent DNA helicase RecQ
VPDALENYYQEAGRAGRDEKRAYAVLLYHYNEIPELEQQSKIRYPSVEEIKKVYKALVNYLQLPKESGEGVYFDFDINDFVKKFNLNINTVSYSLKILEQEDLISYNEQFFAPSTVAFTLNKNDLYEFEKSHPEFVPLIKGLLRSYEGILDYPAAINETQLAKFIQTNQEQLTGDLKRLQVLGIIDYNVLKDKPQILFLQNRMDTQDFTINMLNINKRKLAFEKRIRGMITYVNKTGICRSKMIGNYFNDISIKPCGICDNCINEKNLIIAKEEFENICTMIYKIIDNRSVTVKELLLNLVKFKKNKIWKVLNYLQSENKLIITRDGSIGKRGERE